MRRAIKKTLAGMICMSLIQLGGMATVFADEESEKGNISDSERGSEPGGKAAPTATPAPSPSPGSTPAMDGAALYQTNCAGCHGSLASSSKRGRSATQIQNAIAANTGGMGFLSSLSSEQIQAIATALK